MRTTTLTEALPELAKALGETAWMTVWAFALTLVDGSVRRLVALVLIACGVGIVVSCAGVLLDPAAAIRAPGVVPVSATTSIAPWLTVIGSVPLVLGGVLALLSGDRWPSRPARRADEGAGGAAGTRAARARSDWDALSEGEDPT